LPDVDQIFKMATVTGHDLMLNLKWKLFF